MTDTKTPTQLEFLTDLINRERDYALKTADSAKEDLRFEWSSLHKFITASADLWVMGAMRSTLQTVHSREDMDMAWAVESLDKQAAMATEKVCRNAQNSSREIELIDVAIASAWQTHWLGSCGRRNQFTGAAKQGS